MSKINEFNQEYNKNYGTNQKRTEWILSDFINSAFTAIDNELSELQDDVDSGYYSNQDIVDKIQEIRNML